LILNPLTKPVNAVTVEFLYLVSLCFHCCLCDWLAFV